MISSEVLALIRVVTFGITGLICTGYALGAVLFGSSLALPNWLPIGAAGSAAVLFFLAMLCAGPQAATEALDESYAADKRNAAAAGFWSAIAIGTLLWLTGTGGSMQLAITLTGASAVFLLTQVALDLVGWAWR